MEGLLLRARAGVSAPGERPRPDHARELAPVLDDPALHAYTGDRPATEEALRTVHPAGRGPLARRD